MSDDLLERARFVVQLFRECDAIQLPHGPTEQVLIGMIDRIEELEAKLEAIEALMVRRIQSVSYHSTSYSQDTLSDSRKRKNSVREYALSLALGEIRQVIGGQE